MPTSGMNNPFPRPIMLRHHAAFTLVELLVALVMVVILGAASYYGFRGGSDNLGSLRHELQQILAEARQISYRDTQQIIITLEPNNKRLLWDTTIKPLPQSLRYRAKTLLQSDFREEKIEIRILPVGYIEPFWLEAINEKGERVVYTLVPLTAEVYVDEVLSERP